MLKFEGATLGLTTSRYPEWYDENLNFLRTWARPVSGSCVVTRKKDLHYSWYQIPIL